MFHDKYVPLKKVEFLDPFGAMEIPRRHQIKLSTNPKYPN